jgi:class 3 adenylate cyclase
VVEDNAALVEALADRSSSVAVESDSQGNNAHELYIPYEVEGSQVGAVFELYEPIARFDTMLWRVVRPVLVIPAVVLSLMLFGLTWLVWRARSDIDWRSRTISALRQRLERLVSQRAAAAMRSGETQPGAEMVEVALLYSDVRGFTHFAEARTPAEVVDFLNRIIGLQVEIIEAHGGDVDKMIGDAVLARFHGEMRWQNAIQTAIDIQMAIGAADLPCGVGIGVFAGAVMAGLIGSGDRLDYTVVGDSVNVAARLCEAAGKGEVIADSDSANLAGGRWFGPEESL